MKTRGEHTKGVPDQNAMRRLPAVSRIVELISEESSGASAPPSLVTTVARRAIDAARQRIVESGTNALRIAERDIANDALTDLAQELRPPLGPVINATGVLIHTGLGRAPLARQAVDALAAAAESYTPVELDMKSGLRGRRADLVRPLLCELTGAEYATVVNNNAAAMLLVLSTFARDREVVVSRGELVEIGGSFRLPDVIASGGAILREVGTTNKTRAKDYAKAINDNTGALLKVHTSNFRVQGFTDAVSIAQLAELGRSHDLPIIHDIGSGVIDRESFPGLPGDEPDVRTSIRAGADLVLFSGDKLLGGPQAGIIVGRRDLVDRVERHPLMRALRVGKLTLAALGPTLQLHRESDASGVPIRALLATPADELKRRADAITDALGGHEGISAGVIETLAYLGGGAAPAEAIPSWSVSIRASGVTENALIERLRGGDPPVIARISEGSVLLDLRSVPKHQDATLAKAIVAATDIAH